MTNLRNKFNKREMRREKIDNNELQTFAQTCVQTGMDVVAFKLNNAETTLTVDEVKNYFGEKDGVVKLEEIENELRFNAVVAYVCGSDVAKVTIQTGVGKTITCAEDLAKVFKVCSKKNNGSGVRYITENGESPIFQEGVNIIKVSTGMGMTNTLYKVSYHEQAKFIEVLSSLDLTALTEEDIKMIIRDLDLIGRAMQEIAIDSAKDKSKAKNWKKIDSFINAEVKMLVRSGASDNFAAIKAAKRAKERGVVLGDVETYAMKYNAVLPKDAYTPEEFAALSAEQQIAAENSEVVCGLLGRAGKAILDGTNEEIGKLVKSYYNDTNADKYKIYADKYAAANKQLTVFLNRILDTIALSGMVKLRMSDESVRKVRNAVYNEVANNEILATPFKLKEAMIKHAIAAASLQLKEQKDGTLKETYDANSLRFSELTRLFKDEFILEYTNNPTEIQKGGRFMDLALTVSKKSTVDLIEGAGYKMVSGVATMFSVPKGQIEKVNGVLETIEPFTGFAVCKNGTLYARHDVNKVTDSNIGVALVKNWFELGCNELKDLDLSKTTDVKALDAHIDLLSNKQNKVFISGQNKNLVGVLDKDGKFYPVCRLNFTPAMAGIKESTEKLIEIDLDDVFAYVSPADEEKGYNASIRGMFTYTAK